eukprot:1811422-Amphidinium_carterae.2
MQLWLIWANEETQNNKQIEAMKKPRKFHRPSARHAQVRKRTKVDKQKALFHRSKRKEHNINM